MKSLSMFAPSDLDACKVALARRAQERGFTSDPIVSEVPSGGHRIDYVEGCMSHIVFELIDRECRARVRA